MKDKKQFYTIILLVILACLIMAFVDAIISPIYPIKSFIKIVLFLVIPFLYSYLNKDISFRELFIFNKKSIMFSILLGLSVLLIILSAYFVLGPLFDLSNITQTLESNIGVNIDNFIFVALYISIINSLLEEFFFRGFAFLTLKKRSNRRVAYIFSALTFSLYHIAIMTSWFSPFLFILLIITLFIGGLLFNWLNEKTNNIYTSWMVHMFANIGINIIGVILFNQ